MEFLKRIFGMLNKMICCILPLALSLPLTVLANPVSYKGEIIQTSSPSWLSLGVYGGYGDVSGAYESDGQFTQGRLAFGAQLARFQEFALGLETGFQWGNDMRFQVPNYPDSSPGGLPVQMTLKPLVDLLATCQIPLGQSTDFSIFVKGGIAYRQLQFMDRTSNADTLKSVNGEFQAGLGYQATSHAKLTVFYQGIYSGSSPDLTVDANDDVKLGRVPTQQAGFLGIEYVV